MRSDRLRDSVEPIEVRIVGGTLRGRRLLYATNSGTRPMKDRTREAVFSLVHKAIPQSCAVDLFAGTGALLFESISRGASQGVGIERNVPLAEQVRRHASELGIGNQIKIVCGDTFIWGPRLELPKDIPWMVFCSPPYALYAERAAELVKLLTDLWSQAPPKSAFVVESDATWDANSLPGPGPWDSRSYHPAAIHIAFVQE